MINHYVIMDCEYSKMAGDEPAPILAVCYDSRNESYLRYNFQLEEDVERLRKLLSENPILVSYSATAELSCLNVLGLSSPKNIIDLYVEYRGLRNGIGIKFSLLSAASFFNIETITEEQKDKLREIAINRPQNEEELEVLFKYCEEDVRVTKEVFLKMKDSIDYPRAYFRGEYIKAITRVESNGVPIDINLFNKLERNWELIKKRLIEKYDSVFGFYDQKGRFQTKKFEAYIINNRLKWPRNIVSGRLKVDDQTFKDQCKVYPYLEPIRQLRDILGQMRLKGLEIGSDNRNRTSLRAFASKTGRNQPSSKKNIFSAAAWMRKLVVVPPSKILAYLDYEQQEFGIAACLSGDKNMKRAYQSSDPYLAFGKLCNLIPENASRRTHGLEREALKACVLGVQFGMGVETLSTRIISKNLSAQGVLDLHKKTFSRYWKWIEDYYDAALLSGIVLSNFGWKLNVNMSTKERTVKNFPMQANGAEILRVACYLLDQAGFKICTTIHDAVLLEIDQDDFYTKVKEAKEIMEYASKVVLEDFELRVEAKVFEHPEHFRDIRGDEIWKVIDEVLDEPVKNSTGRCELLNTSPIII